MTLIINMNPSL